MTTLQTHVVLSTAHLDAATSAMLDDMGPDEAEQGRFGDWRDRLVRCDFRYGHWVKVPRPDKSDPDDTLETRMMDVPDSLAGCLRHAYAFGASWVLFDRDEPEIDPLTRYEW